MENLNNEFNIELQEKINSLVTNENIKDIQVELLGLYFGKEWAKRILKINAHHSGGIDKIYEEYGKSGINESLIPSKKEDIFIRFANVFFDRIKAVLLADKPGIIEGILGTDDLSQLEKQGVFILTHELTASKSDYGVQHDGSPWRPFTTEVHGLLVDFDVIEVVNGMSKEQLIESLKQEGITWESQK